MKVQQARLMELIAKLPSNLAQRKVLANLGYAAVTMMEEATPGSPAYFYAAALTELFESAYQAVWEAQAVVERGGE